MRRQRRKLQSALTLLMFICIFGHMTYGLEVIHEGVTEAKAEEKKGKEPVAPPARKRRPPLDKTEQEESTTTTKNSNNNNNNNNMRCRWGEHCPQQDEDDDDEETEEANQTSSPPSTALPCVPPKMNSFEAGIMVPHYKPPEGFVLTARVYTDPDDKLAHFDSEGTSLVLPYWECGAVGSTTSPLQVKNAYFRHALGHTTVASWSGTEYGPHPHLLVPLTPLELVLNSGESKMLKAGDVVLLEDVLSSGHKLKGLEDNVDALIVTLPQHYHHVGKERSSLHKNAQPDHPCPDDYGSMAESSSSRGWMVGSGSTSETTRKIVFGSVGAAMSGMTALFLTKVAPLWLSVGIGGTCFVVGGTGAAVVCGEAIVEQLQTVLERKRLNKQQEEESSHTEEDLATVEKELEDLVENPIVEPESFVDHLMDAEQSLGG